MDTKNLKTVIETVKAMYKPQPIQEGVYGHEVDVKKYSSHLHGEEGEYYNGLSDHEKDKEHLHHLMKKHGYKEDEHYTTSDNGMHDDMLRHVNLKAPHHKEILKHPEIKHFLHHLEHGNADKPWDYKKHKLEEAMDTKNLKTVIETVKAMYKPQPIQEASMMKDDGKVVHNCAKHVEHAEWGKGVTMSEEHADPDANGNIEWYDVLFDHGLEKAVPSAFLSILVSESHGHPMKKKKIAEALHPNQQKLDVHEPEKDKLTAHDFKALRAGKKAKMKEDIDVDETITHELVIEALMSAEVKSRVQGHEKAGHKVSDQASRMKSGEMEYSFVVTQPSGKRSRHIYHGNKVKHETMSPAPKSKLASEIGDDEDDK